MQPMNNKKPGLVVLLGSGETSPNIRKVYDWLFRQTDTPINMAILETPAGFEPNSEQVVAHIGEYIQKHLQNYHPQITLIPARKKGTPHSPDNPEIIRPMYETSHLMAGPGSPSYAVRQWRDSLAWHTLLARHRMGATVLFSSAATIACSRQALPVYEIYKVGEELHWKAGLDFFGAYGLSLVFIPHWNNHDGGETLDTSHCYMGQARYEALVALLPAEQTIVGIDENTALIVDFEAEVCHVMGMGGVTVIAATESQTYPAGEGFPLSQLGAFRQPDDPAEGIPPTVWATVKQAVAELQRPQPETIQPPAEAIALMEQRSAARNARDWTQADALRDQLLALGWQVQDRPDGPVLEPATD